MLAEEDEEEEDEEGADVLYSDEDSTEVSGWLGRGLPAGRGRPCAGWLLLRSYRATARCSGGWVAGC